MISFQDSGKSGDLLQDDITKTKNRVKCTVMVNNKVQNKTSSWLLNIKLNSSGTSAMINGYILPKGFVLKILSKSIQYQTMMETFDSNYSVEMEELIWLEYNKSNLFDEQTAYVIDGDYKYNIILGIDLNT